jgi:hypothetical protein
MRENTAVATYTREQGEDVKSKLQGVLGFISRETGNNPVLILRTILTCLRRLKEDVTVSIKTAKKRLIRLQWWLRRPPKSCMISD